jgi:hypothetical protein
MAALRNQRGELMDDQTMYVTVELAKFTKPLSDITSDLDKLLFTMKTLHTVTDPAQYPQFWTEEWLQLAISELDKRNLTPEELLDYEMTLSANALVVKNERKKIQEAEERIRQEIKSAAVRKSLLAGLPIDIIADINEVSIEFVLDVQRQMQQPEQ